MYLVFILLKLTLNLVQFPRLTWTQLFIVRTSLSSVTMGFTQLVAHSPRLDGSLLPKSKQGLIIQCIDGALAAPALLAVYCPYIDGALAAPAHLVTFAHAQTVPWLHQLIQWLIAHAQTVPYRHQLRQWVFAHIPWLLSTSAYGLIVTPLFMTQFMIYDLFTLAPLPSLYF